ncbi:RNA-binding protein [Candidatus Woesearchaeota archaeon]|nr:RNA-binding protein [Candidatus Woesearchaeota archaeon]
MSKILVKEKSIVTPGEVLAEGMDYLPGQHTYRQGEKILSEVLGFVTLSGRAIKANPLSGPYRPKVRDKIIGKVVDITFSGWRVNTNTAYLAMLNIKDASTRFVRKGEDLSKILAIGDFVVVKLTNVTSQNLIDLTMKEPGLRKIAGGRIIKINHQKVPRVIGREGSMITLIKNKTGCEITVGQNGLVWIKGTPEEELVTEQAIKLIEEKAHEGGLTEKIDVFLTKNSKYKPQTPTPTKTFTKTPTKTFAQTQNTTQTKTEN